MHNYLLFNFLSTFMSMIKDERCIWEKEKETTKQQFSLFRDNRSSWVVLSKHLLKNKGKDLFSNQKNSKQNLNFKIEIFRPQTGGHQNGRFRLMDIDHIQRKRKRKTDKKFSDFHFQMAWKEIGLNILWRKHSK